MHIISDKGGFESITLVTVFLFVRHHSMKRKKGEISRRWRPGWKQSTTEGLEDLYLLFCQGVYVDRTIMDDNFCNSERGFPLSAN